MVFLRKPRTPVKKFVARKLSEKRAAEMQRFHLSGSMWASDFEKVFAASEALLKRKFPPGTTMVFIGRAMRPLFEATRAINEFDRVQSRKRIRYFVTPKSRTDTIPERRIDKAKLIPIIKQNLLELGIASKATTNYFIVDTVTPESLTIDCLRAAIKQINPQARVLCTCKRKGNKFDSVLEGILASENLPPATEKDFEGRTIPLPNKESKIPLVQVAFQQALQNYVSGRKR